MMELKQTVRPRSTVVQSTCFVEPAGARSSHFGEEHLEPLAPFLTALFGDLLCFYGPTATTTDMPKVLINSPAPDFSLQDGDGKEWRLSDHRGKVVVLLFYPGDETPVCTRQLCSVRDRWGDYVETGAEVVGISSDSVESHRKFSEHHNLPLRLLSDSDRRAAELYGAKSLIPGRVARSVFVIDAKGILRYSDVRPIGITKPKDNDVIAAIKRAQAQ